MRRRLLDDRGVASTELALLFGLIILLTLFPIQVALLWHAQQNASLAAELALDVGQLETATVDDATAVAMNVLSAAGQVSDPVIDVQRDAGGTNLVTVTITAKVRYQILPLGWRVSSTAQGRIEEFVGEDDR